MRIAVIGLVGLGALFVGWAAGGCSSDGETPFDAGTLPDGFPGTEDGASPDTSTTPGLDGGDATVGQPDATQPTGEDASDSAPVTQTDSGLDSASHADASDAGHADASDASSPGADASDASKPDAGDAAPAEDASDAATADSGSSDDGGSDGAVADSSVADSSVADAGPLDAGWADAATDASAACATLNGADPITGVLSGVVLSDGGVLVINYQSGSTSSGTGLAPTGDTVTFEAWTVPTGVMSSITVMYWLNTDTSHIQSLPLVAGPGPAGEDSWTATLPAQVSGTTVTWWVQGTDVCHTGTDYYSNNSANYVYVTQ